MEFRFPLADVSVVLVDQVRKVEHPLFSGAYWQMNHDEFAMQVEGVCSFFACNGIEVEVAPVSGADQAAIELYLNGSVYGAILHQRKIIPLHGSSFLLGGKGVLVCGESGSGKSSLTAAFVLDGAGFLTDDVTPLVERNGEMFIWAVSDRIKLWEDSLRQLDADRTSLSTVYPGMEKYYYPVGSSVQEFFRLDEIFVIEISDGESVVIRETDGPEKFEVIRNQIYRYEFLTGMPENEQVFFRTLLGICSNIPLIRILRPEKMEIRQLMEAVTEYRRRWLPE